VALVPPWVRIYRIQRDIPMPLVTSGVEKGNLRELALARMGQLGLRCRDVRTREAGIQARCPARARAARPGWPPPRLLCRDARRAARADPAHCAGWQDLHGRVAAEEVELVRRDYAANGGWETFLSYEDPRQDILVGLLRLRRVSGCAADRQPELRGRCSIVRELHVYGTAVAVHARDASKYQHQVRRGSRGRFFASWLAMHVRRVRRCVREQGYGALLMDEAERIARVEHRSSKLAVISGVGTRHYYRKLGYWLEGPYMMKRIQGAQRRRRTGLLL